MTTLTIESIKKDLADGLKYKEIAEKNGVSLSSVKYVVRLTGYSRHAQATPETIEAMKADRASGMGVKELSVKYGYSFSTISRVTKKSPEAPTAMENASEETKDSGSAADTNILADIVENVKQAGSCENNCIPDIVKEVVSHALDNLANEIHILAGNLEELKADRAQLEKWYCENCNEEVKHGT